MLMTITSIEISNIRRFLDTVKFDFVDSNGQLIKYSFFLMNNGTGKTTTITLIKSLLDGTAEEWTKDEVRSYKPRNRDVVKGEIKLSVEFDSNKYIYSLILDYVKGEAKVYCTSALGGGMGRRRFPTSIENLFTPDFVHRFVFDGEQAEKIMSTEMNEAEDAIKYLNRLDILDDILFLNSKILKQKQDAGSVGTDQSVKNLKTRRDRVRITIERLKKRSAAITNEISNKNIKLSDLKDQIRKIDANNQDLNNKKNDVENDIQKLRKDIEIEIGAIMNSLKSPYLVSSVMCERMIEFGNSMTKLKLPKSISKDFFKELSTQETCICGRHIGQEEKNNILNNAEKYLGSDQQSVLNNIKSNLVNSEYDDSLSAHFEAIRKHVADLNSAQIRFAKIDNQLARAGGEEAINLRNQHDTIIGEIGKLENENDTILKRNDDDLSLTEENNLPKAEAAFRILENRIAVATETNNALNRKQVVERIINEIKRKATSKLKDEIICKTNEKIRNVITDDDVEIDSIESSIKLKERDHGSAGQELSVAYCFIGTLFENSQLQFPFIIDSPCGSMDYHKRTAVASILPSLFNQMIVFVTSAEVERFADQYYSKTNAQFLTVISDISTGDVTINLGKEFFDKYRLEHKEESR